jgi:hypothetical protein
MTTGHARQGTLALVAGLSAVLVPQTAHAAGSDDVAGPVAVGTPDGGVAQPYGGQLARDSAPVGTDDVVDLGLLGFGAINALGMVACGALDALRGPSAGQTRRAMTTRTDPGTVSERPRSPRPRPVAAGRVAPPPARPTGAHRRGRHLRPVAPV